MLTLQLNVARITIIKLSSHDRNDGSLSKLLSKMFRYSNLDSEF